MPCNKDSYLPLSTYALVNPRFGEEGKKLLGQGKVGTIVLAGGHGSRLGFEAPKGCFPVTPVTHKSLYQLLAERVLACSLTYNHDFKLAIMTSDATHEKSILHFEKADYFGLKKEQVSFFLQDNLPLYDEAGNALELTAPNGNGALFWNFAQSGMLASWEQAGIEQITVYTIDNALAEPFLPSLIGLNALHANDTTVVGVLRESVDEQVGVLVEKEQKLAVIEYSEMEESERKAIGKSSLFKHPLANISYFAFSVDFVKHVIRHSLTELPLHKAKKKVRLNNQEYAAIKLEYFIFDCLIFARRAEVLYLDRNEYFAPLKNATGPQSIECVQKQLEAADRTRFFKITGTWPSKDQPFELSPLYGINERLSKNEDYR